MFGGDHLILYPGDRLGMNRLTAVSGPDGGGTHSYAATSRSDGERKFRVAVRHSRSIRVLRLAIPIVVLLAGGATIVVATWLDPLRALAKLPVDLGNLVVSGSKITMQQPRIAGFTHDARPYEVTARAAAQDILKPDLVELQDLHAKMATPDQTDIEMWAKSGLYNSKTEKLTLHDDIKITASTGYDVYMSEAVVDTRTTNVVSDKPVQVKMLKGVLDANSLELAESGDLIRFKNGVTLTLTLDRALLPGSDAGGRP